MAVYTVKAEELIIEYMIIKTQNGYEPSATIDELIGFLNYYKHCYPNVVIQKDVSVLLKSLFSMQRAKWGANLRVVNTAGNMLRPTYSLSAYSSVIASEVDSSTLSIIQAPIYDYISTLKKRSIDTCTCISQENLKTGKCVAATIIRQILDNIGEEYFQNASPKLRYLSIDRVLFSKEYANSMYEEEKKQILQFYTVVSKRVGVLQEKDSNLKLAQKDKCLAKANYELVTQGFEDFLQKYVKDEVYVDVANGTYKMFNMSPVASLFSDPFFKKIPKERSLKGKTIISLVSLLDSALDNM